MTHHVTQPDIVLVGLGIRRFKEMTEQGEKALRNSDVIVSMTTSPVTESLITERYEADHYSLRTLYSQVSQQARYKAYYQSIATVIALAKESNQVAYVGVGSTLYGSSTANQILHYASQYGLSTKVIPTVSSYTTIISAIGINPMHGLVHTTPRTVISDDLSFTDDMHLFLMGLMELKDVGYDETSIDTNEFKEKLIDIYSEDAYGFAVRAAHLPNQLHRTVPLKLSNVDKLVDEVESEHMSFLIPSERYQSHIEPPIDLPLGSPNLSPNYDSQLSQIENYTPPANISINPTIEDNAQSYSFKTQTYDHDDEEINQLLYDLYNNPDLADKIMNSPETVAEEYGITVEYIYQKLHYLSIRSQD